MVKSKKLSKSSLAVIVLALLLVLSLVMGITAAWFNDSKAGESKSGGINFGTVKVSAANGTITYAGKEAISRVVDGDTFTVDTNAITNESNVRVFYKVEYSVELYSDADAKTKITDTTERGWWGGLKETVTYGFLADSDKTTNLTVAGSTITFNSKGAENQGLASPTNHTRYLVAKVTITAVQADNINAAGVKDALGCNDTVANALIAKNVAGAKSSVYSTEP